VCRQSLGGTNLHRYIVWQLPVIPPHTYTQTLLDFIVPRVLELTYTAYDLQPFAQDVGYHGAPFIWDEERRFWLRAELDALYFHLYGISRADVDYIMETFPIVKRKDIAATQNTTVGTGYIPSAANPDNPAAGYYRTKHAILQIYDDMANLPTIQVPAPKSVGENDSPLPIRFAGEGSGVRAATITIPDLSHYQPALNPPPAHPNVAHPS
jgi:hypothetical protein